MLLLELRGWFEVDSSWNVMAHVDAREGKWRGNWRMQWVASTLHTTSELGVSSITTADAHTSAASSRLNWRPHRFKWIRPFRQKKKSGSCACAITFQMASNTPFNSINCSLRTAIVEAGVQNLELETGCSDGNFSLFFSDSSGKFQEFASN